MIIPVFLIIAGLLTNGGFEEGKEAPAGWRVGTVGDVSGKVRWGKNIVFDNKISESGRSLKFLMNEPASEFSSIAANEGFGFESDLIPVEYGRKYLISADVRGEGKRPGAPLPSVIIFVKGFKDDPVKGKVMVYQFQMDCELKKPGEWKHFESDFTIPKETIKEVKVVLYAYYPAGIVWFDNVALEEIKGE